MKYLIVGAGTFGASTAWYLRQMRPDDEVVIIDAEPFPAPSAAGHDLNKIVRAEYYDLLYMELAVEALDMWRSIPLLKPYFHQVGALYAGLLENNKKVVDNWKKLIGSSPAELLEPSEARKMFGGIYRDSDWADVTSCKWTATAGYGDAEEALRAVVQAAVDGGAQYKAERVAKILFGDAGQSIGVETATGEKILGDKILLCTGANTAELLADSAPTNPALQCGDRIVACAAAMCIFKVPEAEMKKYETAPVLVNPVGDLPAECIPPSKSKGLVKCTHECTFTNFVHHEASGQRISVVPRSTSRKTWSQDIPEGLKEETQAVAKKVFGSWVEGLEPVSYRMCWDAFTPNQDWIVCPHLASQNLYLATGASFHGWKFLANMGKYIIEMMDGTLDSRFTTRWAWDRPQVGLNCPKYVPARELKDIKGYVGEQ